MKTNGYQADLMTGLQGGKLQVKLATVLNSVDLPFRICKTASTMQT